MDLDLEGTDGKERGEDDTAFEKQNATFALAVSDIVLINMCRESDKGREQASMNPLLKMVFQVVLHSFVPHKMTLLFVIYTKTPFENLEPVVKEDIQKLWDGVPKPKAHNYVQGTPKQPTSTECGYFVMLFMKEIVEDKNLEFASKLVE